MLTLTATSRARARRYVSDLFRSDELAMLTAERNSDFINEPERAARCYDAAESGASGQTHSEAIDDARDVFRARMRARRNRNEPERFIAAVESELDDLEAWHESNGSLHHEIG